MSRTARRDDKAPATVHFTELIPPGTHIDFIRARAWALTASGVLGLLSLLSLFWGGLNYGIDFAGGTMVHIQFAQPTPVAAVRRALDRPALKEVRVQDVGQAEREFQIVVLGVGDGGDASDTSDVIKQALSDGFDAGSYEVLRVESVGPKVGRHLWRDATLAVLAATLVMGAYIAFRFDLRFGIGAAIALVHDVVLTLGALSLAGMSFDLTTVAGLLTVVGYSVNDTVIVSDRIRENMRKMRRESLATIVNVSINETLSRTIITSGTAVLVTGALFALGGSVIHSFAFTLLVGFVLGTYSSIFVASPVVLYLERGPRSRR